MALQIQTAFSKGEISPTLHGRVDAEMYRAALATARNVICHNYGGVSNRPGLRYLGPVKNHTYAPRFIKFKFKATDTYLLEFGDQYMRVIRENGHVTETAKVITGITAANPPVVTSAAHGFSNGDEVYISGVVGMTQVNGRRFLVAGQTANTFQLNDQVTNTAITGAGYTAYTSGGTVARIYTVATPYAIADVANIKYVQAADVMTLVHQSYAPRELTRTGHATWALSQITFAPNIAYPPMAGTSSLALSPGVSYKVTAVDKDSGEESLAGLGGTGSNNYAITNISNTNPAVVTTSQPHSLSTGDSVYFLSPTGMTGIHQQCFSVAVLTSTTLQIVGYDGTSGGGTWDGSTVMHVSFLAISAITQSNPAKVTFASGTTPLAGDEVYINGVVGMTQLNGRRFIIDPISPTPTTQCYLRGEDSTGHTAYSSGGRLHKTSLYSSGGSDKISWMAVANADKYNIYKQLRGSFGYIGSSDTLDFTDAAIVPDLTKGPPTERNPFSGSINYPSAVGSYEQRDVFGGSSDQPDTSFYSKIGASRNFSSSFPTQADDPIQATLVSNTVNEIRHYVPKNDLIILTEDAEWKVNSGPDSGFSPDTIKQRLQSEWGSSHLRPQTIGDTTLFVPVSRLGIRSLEYSFQTNGYETSDVNTLAPHMFRDSRLSDWTSVKSPDPLVVAVREDGDAPVLMLDVKADAVAWSRWDTLGNFESVGSARAFATDSDDTIYFVVKRTINGQTVRTVEYLADRNLTDVRDSFFVDCGVTYDVPVTISATTAANPVVVTATAHGLANGDYVDISDITWTPSFDTYDTESQPAQLNLTRFKVKNVTANTVELTDQSDVNIDGSAYTAYVSGGKMRKAVTAISGLWHLVNTPVTVLADGIPVTGHTVSSTGTITLATRASRVHVGLNYTSDVETLNIETPQGTSQGRPKKISDVTVRFYRSRGIYYGRDFTKMHQLTQTDFGVLGATPGLFTGDIPVDFPPDWESNGRMAFRQRLPLPMTIVAIIPNLEVGR